MADTSRYRSLSPREQVLVALAVLLDGRDASHYLASEGPRQIALTRAALDCSEMDPGLRVPLVGTLLRQALSELRKEVEAREVGHE